MLTRSAALCATVSSPRSTLISEKLLPLFRAEMLERCYFMCNEFMFVSVPTPSLGRQVTEIKQM